MTNVMHILVLCGLLGAVTAMYNPDLPPGPYCGVKSICCKGRDDGCSHKLLDTICYCDEFCNNGHDDCCPDYFPVCKGESEYIINPCRHNGRFYLENQTRIDECNTCTCVTGDNPMQLKWRCEEDTCLINQDVVDGVNRGSNSWRAYNYSQFYGKKLKDGLIYKLGTKPLSWATKHMKALRFNKNVEYRTNFDSREQWPGFISPVVDQEWCGSDWAISSAAVASDRLAILSNGAERVVLSPQTLLSCNRSPQQSGCEGGHIDIAWNFMRTHGVVDEECFPYQAKVTDCPHWMKGNLVEAGCRIPVKQRTDKYKVAPSGRLKSERDIMYDIMNSGPVQAVMTVYQDFFHYREGIYRHSIYGDQKMSGLHSVRIIGWGEDRGDKYWIVANSWGCNWGENGYFRIARGENESGIESFVVTVISDVAQVKKHPHKNHLRGF